MLQPSKPKGIRKKSTGEEITMLRRSIKDGSVNYNKVTEMLGFEYTQYGEPSPSYEAKIKGSLKSGE